MDTMEFKRILEAVDKELDQAKREWEAKARREQLDQRRRILLHWKDGLEARKAEFSKYGAKPSIDLDAKLAEILKELVEVEGQLSGNGSPSAPPPLAVLDPGLRVAVQELIDEINRAAIAEWPYAERLLQLQEWAIRWKIAAVSAGQGAVDREPVFRVAYAAILNTRDAWTTQAVLPALSRNPGTLEEWKRSLDAVRDRREEAARAREQEERQAKASEDAFAELSVFVGSAVLDGEESLKTFRHLIRKAASFPHLRPEIAEILADRREAAGPEFSFLWSDDKRDAEPEEPAKRLSNRAVIARMCRRLKSKGMIGACHAPAEMVAQGFAGHDYGRSEEALDVLVKAGLVRRRRTGVGIRVSIEPSMMQAVDAAIEERPTGIVALDEWVQKEP